MKKSFLPLLVALGVICGVATPAVAQEEESSSLIDVSASFDIVNQSVWRGGFLNGNVQIQPAMTASIGGFSVTAWGSTPLSFVEEYSVGKELDFTLAYDFELANGGAFGIAATDYWWDGQAAFGTSPYYFNSSSHQWEITLSYTISESVPLSFSWNTMVAGEIDTDADGQMYSTYIEIAYPFSAGPVDCGAAIGITPWTGAYTYGDSSFSVASLSFGASYDLLSKCDKFALPVFVDLIAAPTAKQAYLIAGISFAM